jgi:uncharacterized membrane protein YfcA
MSRLREPELDMRRADISLIFDSASRATAARRSLPQVHWQWPTGAVCAFLVALATTPAGVSGAVLLLPVQVSVLGVASPAVTPTNLLFNVAAVPGGLLRFRSSIAWSPR